MAEEDLKAELERLKAENERLKARNRDLLAVLKDLLSHGTRAEWSDDTLAHSFKLPIVLIRQARAAIAAARGDA